MKQKKNYKPAVNNFLDKYDAMQIENIKVRKPVSIKSATGKARLEAFYDREASAVRVRPTRPE